MISHAAAANEATSTATLPKHEKACVFRPRCGEISVDTRSSSLNLMHLFSN